VRDASIFRFYQSMQVLQSLRGTYASADAAVSFLASVIRKAGISVPAQVAMPSPDSMSTAADSLVRLAANNKGNPDWRESAAFQDTRRSIINRHSHAIREGLEVNSSHVPQKPTKSYPQPNSLLTSNGQIWPTSSVIHSDSVTATMGPSTYAVSTSNYVSNFDYGGVNTTEHGSTREENMFNYEHASSANLSNFTVYCPLEDYSEWNNNHDYAMDHEPIAFNYDFISDAFGFLDG